MEHRASRLCHEIVKERVSYGFLAPFYLLFLLLTIIPVLYSIFLSFTYYNILEPPRWIGLENYTNLFINDDVFSIALKNTMVYGIVIGPVSYIANFLFAWAIAGLHPGLRSLLVLMFYAPSISGNVYLIWKTIFSSDSYGYINAFLLQTGLVESPIRWLENENYILPIIMLVAFWISFGTTFLSFVAGFQGLDSSLLEAGRVDGIRSRWQELWYITLPLMRPQLLFGAIISITNAFAVYDVSVSMAGMPSVNYAGHTIVTHLVDYGSTRFEMGYASAIATLLFLIMVLTNELIKKFINHVGQS